MGKMMLIDTSRCISCRACQVACKMWHALPPETDNDPRTDLTGTTLTLVKEFEAEVGGKIRRLFFKDQCRHCDNAPCVLACPLKATKKLANGAVVIKDTCDIDNCPTPYGGKHACEVVCPYHIPHIDPVKKKARKCDFCYDRIRDGSGRKTTCTDACPTGAISFGSEDTIKMKANRRLKKVKVRYPNANLDGAYATAGRVIWLLTEAPTLYR